MTSLLVFTLFMLTTLAIRYHDEDSRVIWIKSESSFGTTVYVNGHSVYAGAHHVLNHFYDRGYDVCGHSMSDHNGRSYSWTLCKNR